MSIGVDASARGAADVPEIGVGMLGYAFMGKAHANGYRTVSYMAWPPPLRPRLVSIAGRDEAAVSEAAQRFGFERSVTDWRDLVSDPEVQLFDNGGPNSLHAGPTIAAAEAGKHVFCEKPLGRTADESYEMWQRVTATGVRHMTAFNYRFVPAVRLARQMLEAGELGDVLHFRGRYLQEWGTTTADAWRFHKEEAGSGALGDLGAHVIDLARYLVGEIAAVSATTRTSWRAARSTTPSRRSSSSTPRRSGRSRRPVSRPAARMRSAGRSTAPRGHSRSTSSG
jgi:predicted dehydrogenase